MSHERPPYGHRPPIQVPLGQLVLLPALLRLDPHGGGVPRLWRQAAHPPAALPDGGVGSLPVRREVIRRRSHVLRAWTGQKGVTWVTAWSGGVYFSGAKRSLFRGDPPTKIRHYSPSVTGWPGVGVVAGGHISRGGGCAKGASSEGVLQIASLGLLCHT